MPKISTGSISLVRDKRCIKKSKVVADCLESYMTKKFIIEPGGVKKKNEPAGTLIITNGDGESFDLKHSVKDC